HNLVMKHLPGADPELVLLNHYYEELDRILLNDMTRKEINELLVSLGFYKKTDPDDPVPYEFRYAPAKDSPWDKQEPDPDSTEQNQGADREPAGEPLETESQSPETQQHDPQAKHADL
ncbi:UNVERIFIED_CONTAM: hypothetical protein FKN15_001166, partial [Acipenser sinensis]